MPRRALWIALPCGSSTPGLSVTTIRSFMADSLGCGAVAAPMAGVAARGKLHGKFTLGGQLLSCRQAMGRGRVYRSLGGMAGLAMVLFIALFAYGAQYFGWSDPKGWVQLSLVSSFIFGIICGFRIKD